MVSAPSVLREGEMLLSRVKDGRTQKLTLSMVNQALKERGSNSAQESSSIIARAQKGNMYLDDGSRTYSR